MLNQPRRVHNRRVPRQAFLKLRRHTSARISFVQFIGKKVSRRKSLTLPPDTLRRLHFYRLPGEEEEAQRSADIPVNVNPVPAPTPAPIKLQRRLPIKALTTAALGVLIAAVLLPVAMMQYFRTGGGGATNTNTNVSTNPPVTAVEVDIDPVANVGKAHERRSKGRSGSYDLIVKNQGPDPITDVVILEQLSPGLEYVSSEPAPVRHANQLVEWHESQIPQHGQIRIKVFVRLKRTLKTEEELTTRQTITFRDARGGLRKINSTRTPLPRL